MTTEIRPGLDKSTERPFSSSVECRRVQEVVLMRLPQADVKAAIRNFDHDQGKIDGFKEEMNPLFFKSQIHAIDLPNGKTLFVSSNSQELEVYPFNDPYKTNPDSQTIYLATILHKDFSFLLQHLKPMAKSNPPHSHIDSQEEVFSGLGGKLYVNINHDVSRLANPVLRVEAGRKHMVFTMEEDAYTMIAQGPGKLHHVRDAEPDTRTHEELRKTIAA